MIVKFLILIDVKTLAIVMKRVAISTHKRQSDSSERLPNKQQIYNMQATPTLNLNLQTTSLAYRKFPLLYLRVGKTEVLKPGLKKYHRLAALIKLRPQ